MLGFLKNLVYPKTRLSCDYHDLFLDKCNTVFFFSIQGAFDLCLGISLLLLNDYTPLRKDQVLYSSVCVYVGVYVGMYVRAYMSVVI